ncbi:MAG: hypothetical protein AAF611_07235 [Bacteroidota bacterium]
MKTIENLVNAGLLQKVAANKLHSIRGGETTENEETTETTVTETTRVVKVTISNIDSVLSLIR